MHGTKKHFIISWGMILISLFPQTVIFAAPPTGVSHAPGGRTAVAGVADIPSQMDALMRETWRKAGVTPSPKATDGEFIRRAYLDFLGTTPTTEEMRKFLDSKNPKKQQALCREIAQSSGYKVYWATRWAEWLDRENSESVRDSLSPKLESMIASLFREHEFAMDKVVTDLIAARVRPASTKSQGYASGYGYGYGGYYGGPGTGAEILINMEDREKQAFLRLHAGNLDNKKFDMEPATEKSAQLFLGVHLECAKCHDHPFQKWTQADYWGMNASLASTELRSEPRRRRRSFSGFGFGFGFGSSFGLEYFVDSLPVKISYPPSVLDSKSESAKLEATPHYVDGKELSAPDQTMRQQLADRITKDPLFAKAIVNRMWAALFGAGLNGEAPADDFHVNQQNKLEGILHPELLEKLANELKRSGFKLDKLLNWICESEAYQLSSRGNATNSDEGKEALFSRMPLKPLSFNQITEAMYKATTGYSVTRDQERDLHGELFDAGFRRASLQGANDHTAITQALFLLNNNELRGVLWDSQKATKEPSNSNISEAFMSTLGRPPTSTELKASVKLGFSSRNENDVAADFMNVIVDPNSQRRIRDTFVDARPDLEAKLAAGRVALAPRIQKQVKKYLNSSVQKEKDMAIYIITTAIEQEMGAKPTSFQLTRMKALLTTKPNLVDVYGMLFNTTEFTHNH